MLYRFDALNCTARLNAILNMACSPFKLSVGQYPEDGFLVRGGAAAAQIIFDAAELLLSKDLTRDAAQHGTVKPSLTFGPSLY